MFLIWEIPNPFSLISYMPAVFRSWLRLSSQLVSIHCLLNSSRFYSVFTRFHGFHSISRFPLAFSISNSISTQFLNRLLVISTRFHGIYFISTRFHVSSTLFLSISLYFNSISHSVSQPFSRHFDSISRYPLPFDSISR